MDTFWGNALWYLKIFGLVIWTIVSMYVGALIGAKNPQKLLKSKESLKASSNNALAAAKEKLK